MSAAASALGSLYGNALSAQQQTGSNMQLLGGIWSAWNQSYITSASSAVTVSCSYSYNSNATTWVVWNESHQESAEAKAKRDAQEQALRQAKERAEALLLQNLDADQAKQFRDSRSFIVHGRDRTRRYKVGYGIAGNIRLLAENGREVATFCIHPDVKCPTEDVMLAQKLMIEYDEERFLKVANRTALAA